jgi:uncharacterized protein
VKSTINLPFISKLDHNLKHYPDFLQVILGPRQVGKTTSILSYLKTLKEIFHYESADKSTYRGAAWLVEVWQKATQKEASLLVIDEVQKIENWSEVIKSLWDKEQRKEKKLKIVLLGSSSLDLHVGLSESLTGRFQLIKAHHWNYQESVEGYGLNFEEYLKFGGYPASYQMKHDLPNWKQYMQHSILETVIEKDILLNNKVKSPSLFKQAFDILISYPAAEISFTKLLGQLQDKGNVEIIKYYIRLYEGAFLIKTLEKFSTNKIKKRSSAPKIIPLCPAFIFLQDLGEYNAQTRGHVFECLVAQTLLRLDYELYYWREGSHEVDFILKFGKRIWAIEVKSGRRKNLSGLDSFLKKFPDAIPVVITPENYIEFEKSPQNFLRV